MNNLIRHLTWVLALALLANEAKAAEYVSLDGRQVEVLPAMETGMIEKRLAARGSVNFVQTPLKDALDLIASATSVNVIVDPRVGLDTRVSFRLEDVSFDCILRWATKLTGHKYYLEDGGIFVIREDQGLTAPVTILCDRSYVPSGRCYQLPVVQATGGFFVLGSKGIFFSAASPAWTPVHSVRTIRICSRTLFIPTTTVIQEQVIQTTPYSTTIIRETTSRPTWADAFRVIIDTNWNSGRDYRHNDRNDWRGNDRDRDRDHGRSSGRDSDRGQTPDNRTYTQPRSDQGPVRVPTPPSQPQGPSRNSGSKSTKSTSRSVPNDNSPRPPE